MPGSSGGVKVVAFKRMATPAEAAGVQTEEGTDYEQGEGDEEDEVGEKPMHPMKVTARQQSKARNIFFIASPR